MGGDGAQGIADCRSFLYAQPFDGVRIVACPDLRMVAEHSRIETPAATRTAFKEYVGIFFRDIAKHVVKSEIIFMHERRLRHFIERTIHIPLDIGYISRREQFVEKIFDKGDHFGVRQIQHLLIAGKRSFAPGAGDGKSRLLFRQLADGTDHFRLYPDTEFQPEPIDLLRESLYAVGKFLQIGMPISERSRVVVAFSEPAVVEDEQFDARFLRVSGDFQDLRLVKIEICAFPAVDEYGTRRLHKAPRQNMGIEKIVIAAAHAVDSLRREAQQTFGRLEGFSRRKRPFETAVVNAAHHPDIVIGVHVYLKAMIAAVYEHHAQRVPFLVRRILIAERDERIEVVTAFPRRAADFGNALKERLSLKIPFLCPRAAQRNHLRLRRGLSLYIQRAGKRLMKRQRVFSRIDDSRAARDDVAVVENSIGKLRFDAVRFVRKGDGESLARAAVRLRGRQTFQSRFSVANFMFFIFERKHRRLSCDGGFHSGQL